MAIEWRDSMATGLSVIDNDHKNLIIMINTFEDLVATINEKSDKEAAIELDQEFYLLHDYTKTHFRREEMIMKALNFPELKKHYTHHQKLIKRLVDAYKAFKVQREQGNLEDSITELNEILNDWLLDHVIKEDLKIKPLAKNHLMYSDQT